MSENILTHEKMHKQQRLIGMVYNEKEPIGDPSTVQIQEIIGRVHNSLPGRGEASEAPIGRTNNSLPSTGQPTEPPVGVINNELHLTK